MFYRDYTNILHSEPEKIAININFHETCWVLNIQAKPKGENQNVVWFYAWFSYDCKKYGLELFTQAVGEKITLSLAVGKLHFLSTMLHPFLLGSSYFHVTFSLNSSKCKGGFIALGSSSRTTMEGSSVFHIGQMKKQHKNMNDRNWWQKCPLMWNVNFEMSGTHWLSCNRINLIPAAPNKIPQMRNKSSANSLRR